MDILQWNKTAKHFYMQMCYALHKSINDCSLLKVTNNQKYQQQTNVYFNSIINMNYPLNDKANNTNYTILIYLIGMSPNTSLPLSQK